MSPSPKSGHLSAATLAVLLCVCALTVSKANAQTAAPAQIAEISPPGEGMMAQPCPALPDVPPLPLTEPGDAGEHYTPEWIAAFVPAMNYQKRYDWPFLCRYARQDADVAQAPLVVFMGDSITQNWGRYDEALFASGYVNRGISGQTSPQMLLRFYQDVVALHPRVVHIMAGSNDIGGNTGPTSPEQFENNIRAMVDIAQANNIRVVLASIPPSSEFRNHPRLTPAPQIVELNTWLRAYAAQKRVIYADYYSALVNADGGMRAEFTFDGLHPATAGYQVMRPIAEQAIEAAERQRR
jgi:lysophospholipase L1-like esterase